MKHLFTLTLLLALQSSTGWAQPAAEASPNAETPAIQTQPVAEATAVAPEHQSEVTPKAQPEPEIPLTAAPDLPKPGDLSRIEFRATLLLFYGTAFGIFAAELGWVSPEGYLAELQGAFLQSVSAGGGQQLTLRVGKRWDSTDNLVRGQSSSYSGTVLMLGLRYGEFPYMGTSDGYDYKSTDLGVQLGLAWDWGYGSLAGFASRIEALITYNVYSDPNYGGDWTYAGELNPTVTFDVGVLFGFYNSLE